MREGAYYIKHNKLLHRFYWGRELSKIEPEKLIVNGRSILKYLGTDVKIIGKFVRKCYIYDEFTRQKRFFDRKIECFK